VSRIDVATIREGEPAYEGLAHAPILHARPNTIGKFTDVPLLMWYETGPTPRGRSYRYSVIFSNEDGGTATDRLMATWGRTTDIEFVYEIEWQAGRVVQERIQAPDHKILPFNGAREGHHPYLLVGTLNNMVMDRGLSVAAVRPMPIVVDLTTATRESVMDREPWSYTVMARELAAEGRIGADVKDPREYLFVEAKLDLQNAAAAVVVQSPAGRVDSAAGNETWAVDRNGWVRIAVQAPPSATAIQWRCAPRKKTAADVTACAIELSRAFRLDQRYLPGPNLLQPRQIRLADGASDPVPLAPVR
jgi:hypothetical protein